MPKGNLWLLKEAQATQEIIFTRIRHLGFEFSCRIEVKEKEFYKLLDSFLDLIESRNLCFDGGGDLNAFNGFVCSNERYASASSDDQLALRDWLAKLDSVTNVKVDALVGVNYTRMSLC